MNLALFDLDHTLIAGDSDAEWPKFLIKRGLLEADHHLTHGNYFYQQYVNGSLDIFRFLEFQLAPLARFSRQQLDALHAEYMDEHIRPIILQKARDLLASHLSCGDEMVIITATNRFIATPIASELGISHLIAVDLEEDENGNFTGRVSGVPSFRDGKVQRLEQWLTQRGETLATYDKVFFYSDSLNDIPLLTLVSHPVAVDPDATLHAHALKCGWPVLSLRD